MSPEPFNTMIASLAKTYTIAREALAPRALTTSFRGIPVAIEKPRGYVQQGIGQDGTVWTRVFGFHRDGTPIAGFLGYGCVPGTAGLDGEDLDVYLGADEASEEAYLILQGEPDPEHKLMLGWPNAQAAVDCYTAHVPAEMLQEILPVPVSLIQALLAERAAVGKASCALREDEREVSFARRLRKELEKVEWSTAMVNDLPDSAFLHIEPGGEKDADGKTTPRTLRHFPYRGPDGEVDLPHLRNALSRLPQAGGWLTTDLRDRLVARAQELLAQANKCTAPDARKKPSGAEDRVRYAETAGGPAFRANAQIITKAFDDELRYVCGAVLEPLDPTRGEADTQGDSYTADEIRRGMWHYMMFCQNISLNHKAFMNGRAYVVECWQTKSDMDYEGTLVRAGTWMLGVHVPDDELWGMLKRRELRAFSIGGSAERTPVR